MTVKLCDCCENRIIGDVTLVDVPTLGEKPKMELSEPRTVQVRLSHVEREFCKDCADKFERRMRVVINDFSGKEKEEVES